MAVTSTSPVLADLLKLGSEYSGCAAQSYSRLYADLDINGSDLIEFVEEVERRYAVDFSWICPPHGSEAEPQDPTIIALADFVIQQWV